MQQKLAIAAALLHDPEILLLDEPTLGLDVQAAKQLESTIAELAQGQGKAILLTSHMMPLAEKLADRIFVIHEGREVAFDTTRSLLARYNAHQDITEIQVVGELPVALISHLQHIFPGLAAVPNATATLLKWPGLEQADWLQLLHVLDEQGQIILDVGRRQASLEEVFLSLTSVENPNG
jgi:ABC-2 type transport system ATP-binding protein